MECWCSLIAALVLDTAGGWWKGDLLTAGVADLVPGGLLNPLPWIVVLIAVLDSANGWWHVVRR
ncbi:MAG: hypothetical protein U0R28_07905 [Candidatus Nanopelagicales bacterium]